MFKLNFVMILNAVIAGLIIWLIVAAVTKRKTDLKTGAENVSFAGSPVANLVGYTDEGI